MSKYSAHQRQFHDILKEKPGKQLTQVNGNYYANEHGQVGEFITLDERERRRKYGMVQRNNEARSQKWYVNCYHEPIREVTQKLKLNELGALIKLLPFLRFNKDGLLTKENKPMKIKDISEVIDKGERATKTIVASLIEHEVIRIEGVKKAAKYYVNERFHTMGYTLEGVTYTKLYHRETRLRAENLSIQEAGLLYKTLPYFHFANYYLCANPDAREENGETIEHLSMTDLAEIIGEEYQTVKRLMNGLIRNGFVMKVTAFKAVNFLVNPDVMFRSERETDYTETIRRQFAELDATSKRLQ